MASQTQGIQQLLAAEKRAAEKINEARKRKAQRLKQAKQEAQAEIEKYRVERERQFKEYEQKYLGKKEDIEMKIKQDTEDTIKKMEDSVVKNKQQIFEMIEITVNDRLGKKVRIKCNPNDTIGDLKKLIAAQTGTRFEKIVLKKWYTIYKDHITLQDYEIHDGFNFELYYQ
ncbi:unnamed protein product [Onchocerca ochengi]|uniref:V-type proton ATPase subunit G n=3 Tax=Onchocerca TaxID=6281 RepID=A0A182E757_ONCOC|nr:unnamed protein product [Onchocerca ochengi]